MKMKKTKTDIASPGSKSYRLLSLKKWTFLLLFTLFGAGGIAQTVCPGSGWENEPVQDPDGCCILFDLLPSTPDFPWAYWFLEADGTTYSNSDFPIGEFPICFEEAGMENVVITYVDTFGATLCENNWTVFVESGCGVPCEDCVNFEGITVAEVDGCDYEFSMDFTVDLSCEGITILSQIWDFGYFGGTGSGVSILHSFPGDGTYVVTGTIEYTIAGSDAVCTEVQTTEVTVTGCTIGGIECVIDTEAILSSSDNELTILLPTRDLCEDPNYVIEFREFGSTDPFVAASAVISEPMPGVFEAHITDLDPCTPYEVKVTLQCAGGIEGICINSVPYVTDCPPPCTGCLTFNSIDIIEEDRCDYTFSANYEKTDACGDIRINSIDWDFGFDGIGSSASGEMVDMSFLCGGTYTVTATISYTTYPDIECTATITREIETDGCDDDCAGSCYLDDCISVHDLTALHDGGCNYHFIFDHSLGDCGSIDLGSVLLEWDFGYPGGTVASVDYWTPHSFPANGTYIVTLTLNYVLLGEEEERECTLSIEVEVTDCEKREGRGKRSQVITSPGSGLAYEGITASMVPNPADDLVTFTVFDRANSLNTDVLELVIFDINGKPVYRDNARLGVQKTIDVSYLESGLYIYEVREGDTVLLKEKLLIK